MPTAEEIDQLCRENLALATWTVKKYVLPHLSRAHVRALDHEDIMQEGRVGLFRAATRYNPARGKFTTFAVITIRRHVQRWIDQQLCRNIASGTGAIEENPVDALPGRQGPNVADAEMVRSVLTGIRKRHARILRLRFLQEHTTAEIAVKEGVCRERVRQLIRAALHEAREALGSVA